jgi:hypothetical protein
MEETLRGIAARNCITVWAIQNASGIWNTNLIYAGQVLYIPTGWCGWCQPHPGPCGIHIVCWGETLSGIARHYGVGPWAIAAANGIYKMNLSCADKRLAIPCDARSAVLDGRTCPVKMWHEMASVSWIWRARRSVLGSYGVAQRDERGH